MLPEEMEQLLASASTRRLTQEAERRILDSIADAAGEPKIRWWMRRVPLWQTAAACLIVCLATLFGARVVTADRNSEPDPSQTRPISNDVDDKETRLAGLVRMDQPIFGSPAPPEYRVDIAKWQFQTSTTE